MPIGIGAILGAASLAGSIFGGNKKGTGTPERSTQNSGYAALPPQGQQAYNSYFNMLNNLASNPNATNRMGFAQQPQDIFGSQELYNLQQTQPGQGVKPIGSLEPFNQTQQNALGAYANPDYSQQGLSQYLQPFQGIRDRVLENINRNAQIGFSGIKGREARMGSLGRSALYGGQLPQLEEARARALGDAEANYTLQGLGLRQQSLSDMLNAGNLIQKQNQVGLQAASGQGLAMSNPAYGQAQAYMNLLQGMPNSGTGSSIGAVAPQQNNLSKLGGLGLGLFGNQFGGIFG